MYLGLLRIIQRFLGRLRVYSWRHLFSDRIALGSNIRTRRGIDLRVDSGKPDALVIGDNVFINSYTVITCLDSITIGKDTVIGPHCSIFDHDHDYSASTMTGHYIAEPIIIGSNVWIGANVTITKGVHIGSNSVIAANAVVTSDIPTSVVAGGVPAKVIKHIQMRS